MTREKLLKSQPMLFLLLENSSIELNFIYESQGDYIVFLRSY